jgi:hypothetical protein
MKYLFYAIMLLFTISPILAIWNYYRYYKMWQRCRCTHYFWQTMADFAGESLRNEDGSLSDHWLEVVREHEKLLGKFKLGIVSDEQRREYERELWLKGIPTLLAHH